MYYDKCLYSFVFSYLSCCSHETQLIQNLSDLYVLCKIKKIYNFLAIWNLKKPNFKKKKKEDVIAQDLLKKGPARHLFTILQF